MTNLTTAIMMTTFSALGGCLMRHAEPTRVTASSPGTRVNSRVASSALPRYHSKRLGLSVPLPEGDEWRIDDHSSAELVATHAPTRSRVVIAIFRTDALVGRAQCEDLARAHELVPTGDLRTLEDALAVTQDSFDTRVWVAIQTGGRPNQALIGHVMAFGGFLRKCYVFGYSTVVDGASDEPILSSRLAFARTRILGGLELDTPGAPKPTLPRAAPAGGETEAH